MSHADHSHSALMAAVARGVGWNVAHLLLSRGVGYGVLLILVGLLSPKAFGLVGMTTVFTGLLAVVSDLGMSAALLQRAEQRLRPEHLNSAFWVMTGFNVVLLGAFAVFGGHWVAQFYSEPTLAPIVASLAVQSAIISLAIVPRAVLLRGLRFRELAIIEIVATSLSGGVALIVALRGAGVWTLVVQVLAAAAITTPLIWWRAGWMPQLQLSRSALGDLVSFGRFDLVHRLLVFTTNNLDLLLVGKLLGAHSLGIYSVAFMLTNIIRQQVMAVISKVMFPVYGRIQGDLTAVRRFYLSVVRYNVLVVTPAMLLVILLVEPATVVAGGEWSRAEGPITILAMAAIVHALGGSTDTVFKGIGRPDLIMKLYLAKTIGITIPALVIGIVGFGLNGAAIAVFVHKAAGRMIYQYHMKRLVGVTEIDVLRAAAPAAAATVAALVIVVVARMLVGDGLLGGVFVATLALAAYLGSVMLLIREELLLALRIMRKRLPA